MSSDEPLRGPAAGAVPAPVPPVAIDDDRLRLAAAYIEEEEGAPSRYRGARRRHSRSMATTSNEESGSACNRHFSNRL